MRSKRGNFQRRQAWGGSMTEGSPTSKAFEGFPAGARGTVIPSAFFSELLPLIDDEAELRVTLYLFYALGRRKGYPRFVTQRELLAEAPLLAQLSPADIERSLSAAAARGSILRHEVEDDGKKDLLLFLNTPSDRRAVEQLRERRIGPGRPLPAESAAPAPQQSNVFRLYEANIGALTPLVADELLEAERLYPYEWLEEAMREAALLNKRSWRYIAAILQRWATEGRTREKVGRDPGEGNTARAQFLRRHPEVFGRQ
jgi:DnaD/phage-associated family protein